MVAAAFECTLLVPVERLREKLPSYTIQVLEVNAGNTVSPLTGAQSPLNHTSARRHGHEV